MARITVEDCLKKIPSRFTLVHIASERGRGLIKGKKPLVTTDNKAVVTALREIAAGIVTAAQEKPRLKGPEEGEASPEA